MSSKISKVSSVAWLAIVLLSTVLLGCSEEKKEIDNIKLANFYLELGNDKQALEILGAELDKGKTSPDAHAMLGSIFKAAEFYEDAIFHYKLAIESGCQQECVEGLVDAFLESGELVLAEQEFLTNVSDKSSEESKYRSILIDFYKRKNYQQTIERLKLLDLLVAREKILQLMLDQRQYAEIVSRYEKGADYSRRQLLVFSKAHYELKQYKKSEEILIALNLKSGSRLLTRSKILATDLLVKVNVARNNVADAELIFKTFLKNNEGTGYVTFHKALAQLESSNFDAAIGEIDTLAKNNPENINIAQVLAAAYSGKKNYQAVIRQLEPFKSHLNEQSRYLLAVAYNNLGRFQDTIDLFLNVDKSVVETIVLARAYLLRKDDQKALSLLNAGSISEESEFLNLKLGEIWLDLGQFSKIVSSFSADFSHPSGIKYLVINSYIKLEQVSAARQYIKKEPDSKLAAEMLGYLEASVGNNAEAIRIYKNIAAIHPTKRAHFLLSSMYIKNEKFSEALHEIQTGAMLHGDNRVLLLVANRLLQESGNSETYEWLDSIKKGDPDFRASQGFLASYDIDKNKSDIAIKRLTPLMGEADGHMYYLMAKAKQNSDPDESLRLMERSLETRFSMEVASILQRHYVRVGDESNLGRINGQIEQFGGINIGTATLLGKGYLALQQFDQARELASNLKAQGHTYLGLELVGDILVGEKKLNEAIDVYSRLVDKNTSESFLLKYFNTRIAASQSNLTSVLSDAEVRLARNPEMHRLRTLIGTVYIDRDNEAAIRHFRSILDEFPDNPVVLNNLAWASLEIDPESALKYSRVAFAANDKNDDVFDTYVRALAQNGQIKTAKDLLKGRLLRDPDNQDLKKLMESLN